MPYPADPGGVFDTDVHRRVLAHLPVPGGDPVDLGGLYVRMAPDVGTDFSDGGELGEVLKDLEADGHANETKAGWKQTKRGHDALNK